VWLNAGEPAPRRRFTLAHEVGHWVCQVLEGRGAPIMCRAEVVGVGEGKALEREANVFAAELLMPEGLVRASFDGTAAGTAAQFGVSDEAMGWRLYNLAVLTTRPSLMAKLDWDRETRETRKRKQGVVPVWADLSLLSLDDERQVMAILDPMLALVNEYERMSRTQQRQRPSEFRHRLSKLRDEAIAEGGALRDLSARESVRRRADVLVERLSSVARGAAL
jgi:hypothetical protein